MDRYKRELINLVGQLFSWIIIILSSSQIIVASKCPPGMEFCLSPRAYTCFDPKTSGCCDGMTFAKTDGLDCCYQDDAHTAVYNTSTHICCGDKLFSLKDRKDEICCDGQLRSKHSGICCGRPEVWHQRTGENIRCCENGVYDTAYQECCVADDYTHKVHQRGGNTSCCQLEVYDMQTQHCTPRGIVLPKDQDFCGSGTQQYTTTQQICCEGTITDYPSYTFKCCGSKPQHKLNDICCWSPDRKTSKVWSKAQSRKCCGSDYVNEDRQRCCNNKVIDLDKAAGLTECCGDGLHNSETSLCCNGVSHKKHDNYECCGSKTFDNRTQKCMYGQIRSKLERQCKTHESDCMCGGEKIHSFEKLCCYEKPTKLDSPTDNHCCVFQDKVRTFNTRSTVPHPCQSRANLCEGRRYDPLHQLCCENKLFRRRSLNHWCCGNKPYKKTRCNSCIGNLLVKKPKAKCSRRGSRKCCRCNMTPNNSRSINKLLKSCKYNTGFIGEVDGVRSCNGTNICKRPSFEMKAVLMMKSETNLYEAQRKARIEMRKKCWQKCLPKEGEVILILTNSIVNRKFRYKLQGTDYLAKIKKSNLRKLKSKMSTYMSQCNRYMLKRSSGINNL